MRNFAIKNLFPLNAQRLLTSKARIFALCVNTNTDRESNLYAFSKDANAFEYSPFIS